MEHDGWEVESVGRGNESDGDVVLRFNIPPVGKLADVHQLNVSTFSFN